MPTGDESSFFLLSWTKTNRQHMATYFSPVLINRFAWKKDVVTSHHEEALCHHFFEAQRALRVSLCYTIDATFRSPPLRVRAMMNRMSRSRRPCLNNTGPFIQLRFKRQVVHKNKKRCDERQKRKKKHGYYIYIYIYI